MSNYKVKRKSVLIDEEKEKKKRKEKRKKKSKAKRLKSSKY